MLSIFHHVVHELVMPTIMAGGCVFCCSTILVIIHISLLLRSLFLVREIYFKTSSIFSDMKWDVKPHVSRNSGPRCYSYSMKLPLSHKLKAGVKLLNLTLFKGPVLKFSRRLFWNTTFHNTIHQAMIT